MIPWDWHSFPLGVSFRINIQNSNDCMQYEFRHLLLEERAAQLFWCENIFNISKGRK